MLFRSVEACVEEGYLRWTQEPGRGRVLSATSEGRLRLEALLSAIVN